MVTPNKKNNQVVTMYEIPPWSIMDKDGQLCFVGEEINFLYAPYIVYTGKLIKIKIINGVLTGIVQFKLDATTINQECTNAEIRKITKKKTNTILNMILHYHLQVRKDGM